MDTKRLRELAEKAPAGPWHNFETRVYFPVPDQGGLDVRACPKPLDLAAYLAAASPSTILSLLDEYERMRECLSDTVAFIEGDISGPAQREGILNEARQALEPRT